jgi:hypothetical protein
MYTDKMAIMNKKRHYFTVVYRNDASKMATLATYL